MERYGIFVDAGYLFSQGSKCLYGENVPRRELDLKNSEFVDLVKRVATTSIDRTSLLRIYWYDALIGSSKTTPQLALARMNDVKLRLGTVNTAGQQKGVDSLLVTDLIKLSQNRAISDAVLLTGDEDMRVGVQLAQEYGIRVHLLGILRHRE